MDGGRTVGMTGRYGEVPLLPLLAQMRSADRPRQCLLFGADQTYRGHHEIDASDPKRTWWDRLPITWSARAIIPAISSETFSARHCSDDLVRGEAE